MARAPTANRGHSSPLATARSRRTASSGSSRRTAVVSTRPSRRTESPTRKPVAISTGAPASRLVGAIDPPSSSTATARLQMVQPTSSRIPAHSRRDLQTSAVALDMFGQPIEAAPGQRRPGDDDNSPAVLVHHPIALLLAGSRPNLGLGPRRSTQKRRSGTTADDSPRGLTASYSSFMSPDAERVPPGLDRVGRSRDRASLAPPAPARARRTKVPARSIPVLGGRWAVSYFAFSIALSTSFAPLA
jgi:hypothetical protein